jgi:predicted Zn-dependent protease
MKQVITVLTLLTVGAAPASAQLGGILNKAQKAQEQKAKLEDLNVNDEQERRIGEDVSVKIRQRFGVVQDVDVHKYVSLVGTLLAQQTERPNLAWTFIVLDTDGVNAFAAPGGFVHITRGALGLIRNESELAGVLAHEITHVTHKHTVNAIRKSKAVTLGGSETLSDRGPLLDRIANRAYAMVLENAFDRGDELDADKEAIALTQKVGYASSALADFLTRLDDRNKDQAERNGLFASHPETKERIEKIKASAKGGAAVEARYKARIKYEPTPITAIAAVADGAAGLTGSADSGKDAAKSATTDKEPKKEEPKEEPKKKGFGLGGLVKKAAPERESTQVSASGGARGLGPDRAAKGGSNPAPVKVTVSVSEIEAFKKGIA